MIPVGPGIKSALPNKVTVGEKIQLKITGYNTHFNDEGAENSFWLKKDSFFICAENIIVSHNDHAIAEFVIPVNLNPFLVNRVYDLVANNNIDGSFILNNAVTLLENPSGPIEGSSIPECEPEVNTNSPSYISFPYRIILFETIRNLFYHVPMWFGMTFILLSSFVFSILFLKSHNPAYDILAAESVNTGILFGLLGFATGSLWGNFAWGDISAWILGDTKILGAIIGLLMYFAYSVLRGSMEDEDKRARISAVYNIFAFVLFIVFIFVFPRMKMSATLHPDSGGNPAFNIYDVDNTLRWIFYPAVLGWIFTTVWITSLRARIRFMRDGIKIK